MNWYFSYSSVVPNIVILSVFWQLNWIFFIFKPDFSKWFFSFIAILHSKYCSCGETPKLIINWFDHIKFHVWGWSKAWLDFHLKLSRKKSLYLQRFKKNLVLDWKNVSLNANLTFASTNMLRCWMLLLSLSLSYTHTQAHAPFLSSCIIKWMNGPEENLC